MRSGARPPMARDCRLMSPDVGANEPDIRWNSVDLPAPADDRVAFAGAHRQVHAADDLRVAEGRVRR